jgi:hypothetical protein
MARPSVDHVDRGLHRLGAEPVQGFLEGLIGSPEHRTATIPCPGARSRRQQKTTIGSIERGFLGYPIRLAYQFRIFFRCTLEYGRWW